MMWWILLGLQAHGAPDLPKLEAFDSSLTRLEGLLDASEASGDSLAEVQATFTNQDCVQGRCPQDLVVALQDAARTFGQRYRLDVQATRAQAGRVERLSDVPTISPLIDAERRRRLRVVRERVQADSERFLKRSAWNRRFVIGQRWVRPGVVEEVEERLDPLLLPLPQGMAGANIAAIRSTVLPESQRPGPDLTGVAEGEMLTSELASALGEWGLLWVEAVEELPGVEEEAVEEPVPDDPTYDPGFGEPGYVPRAQRKPVVDPTQQGAGSVDPGEGRPPAPGDPWRPAPEGPSETFERPALAPGSAVPSRRTPVVPAEDLRPDPVTPQPAAQDPGRATPAPAPVPAERPEPVTPSRPPADLEEPSPRESRRERRRQRREDSDEGGQTP